MPVWTVPSLYTATSCSCHRSTFAVHFVRTSMHIYTPGATSHIDGKTRAKRIHLLSSSPLALCTIASYGRVWLRILLHSNVHRSSPPSSRPAETGPRALTLLLELGCGISDLRRCTPPHAGGVELSTSGGGCHLGRWRRWGGGGLRREGGGAVVRSIRHAAVLRDVHTGSLDVERDSQQSGKLEP